VNPAFDPRSVGLEPENTTTALGRFYRMREPKIGVVDDRVIFSATAVEQGTHDERTRAVLTGMTAYATAVSLHCSPEIG